MTRVASPLARRHGDPMRPHRHLERRRYTAANAAAMRSAAYRWDAVAWWPAATAPWAGRLSGVAQRRTGREVDAEPREPRRATLVPRMEAVQHPSGLVENSNGWSHTGLLGGAEVRCSSAPVGDSHRAGRRYGDLSTATMEPAAVKPCRRPSNHGAIQDHYLVVADALVRIASDHSVRMVTSAWKSVVSKGAFRLYARCWFLDESRKSLTTLMRRD
jgi:hypothetical protein